MKITLEEPFCNDWRSGYLRKSSNDSRARIDLYNSNKDRTTISYARYLMSVHIGRYLTDEEEVDHINSDCSDDRIENLQLLDTKIHRKKTSGERSTGRSMVRLRCPACHRDFDRETRNVRRDRNNYKNNRTGQVNSCSRSCNGTMSHRIRNMDNELIDLIRSEQIILEYNSLENVNK